jgi:hypothetical protein
MPAYELMDRMSMPEILEWIEYDQCAYDPAWTRNAMLLAKLDALTWRKGRPKPQVGHYLPQVKKLKHKGQPGGVAALRLRLDRGLGQLSMSSFGLKPGPASPEVIDGR